MKRLAKLATSLLVVVGGLGLAGCEVETCVVYYGCTHARLDVYDPHAATPDLSPPEDVSIPGLQVQEDQRGRYISGLVYAKGYSPSANLWVQFILEYLPFGGPWTIIDEGQQYFGTTRAAQLWTNTYRTLGQYRLTGWTWISGDNRQPRAVTELTL